MLLVAIAFASGFVGLVAGAIAVWLVRSREVSGLIKNLTDAEKESKEWRAQAEREGRTAAVETAKAARVQELEVALRNAEAQLNRLTGELAEARARGQAQEEAAAHQISTLAQVREGMLSEFKVVASETMKAQGDALSQQNKEQMDIVLSPLRERITEFQQGLQNAHIEGVRERASLAEQIKNLTGVSAKMTQETENLTRALKGDVKTQGVWGEVKLEMILEHSGLRKGEDYVMQQTYLTEDGARLRPDVIINLPDDKRLVIDAKVSLTSFEKFMNAETDALRTLHLKQHVVSMRSHIGRLASKEYWQIEGARVDYVVMFVPIEGALGAALQNDPDLTLLAVEQGVAISTPTTLMTALKTVASLLRVERQNRNAEEIADRAGRLYDKFVGFISDMEAVGGRLDSAKTSYTSAMSKLSTGPGNLVRQVELLKDMGAMTKKSLPKNLIDEPSQTLPSLGEEGEQAHRVDRG